MKEVRGFIKGIKKDMAFDKTDPQSMYSSLNFKIINEDTSTLGALENEKGNKILFKIPSIQEARQILFDPVGPYSGYFLYQVSPTYTQVINVSGNTISEFLSAWKDTLELNFPNGIKYKEDSPLLKYMIFDDNIGKFNPTGGITESQYLAKVDSPIIIGGMDSTNKAVIFTTDSKDEEPNSSGQIWLVEYDYENETIIGLDSNGFLDPDIHLKHFSKLNLSTKYPIGNEVVINNENEFTFTVYFTDNYNEFRSINLLEENVLLKSANSLGLASDVNFSQPMIQSVGSEGSLPSGYSFQYFYRLLDDGGKFTVFSPGSQIVPLPGFDKSTRYVETDGKNSSFNNHSIKIEIPEVDTNYKVIEVVYLRYSSGGNFIEAKRFHESLIQDSNSLTITHTGNEEEVSISEQELTQLTAPFKVCKTIATKGKHLLAGNTRGKDFDLDFDARAYRFNSSRIAELYKADLNTLEATINGAAGNYPTDETLDAVNLFNFEGLPTYTETGYNAFKFQADGVTLGGEGPNVKYKFISQELFIRNSNSAVHIYDTSGSSPVYVTSSVGDITGDLNINGYIMETSGWPYNYKNPLLCAYFTGFMAGEVYRLGFVFYDKKGNKSFVKWMGDVKFPERYDTDSYGFPLKLGNKDGNNSKTRAIGLEINMDISSIKTEIQGIELVYVKRTSEYKTRLGSGGISAFGAGTRAGTPAGKALGEPTINGTPNYVGLGQYPYVDATLAAANTAFKKNVILLSTLGYNDDPISIQSGDYLKSLAKLDGTNMGFVFPFTPPYVNGTIDQYKWYNEGVSTYLDNLTLTDRLTKIDSGRILTPLETVANDGFQFRNSSQQYKQGSNYYDVGIGGYNLYLHLDEEIKGDNVALVSYFRPRRELYGGNSYEARSKNSYISTNYFFKVKDNSPNGIGFQAYGGDTYIGELHHHYIFTGETAKNSGTNEDAGGISLGLTVPVESSINFALRGENDSTSRFDDLYYQDAKNGTYNEFLRLTNLAGRDVPNGVALRYSFTPFFAKDFLLKTTEIHKHRVWISQQKLDGELLDSWRNFNFNDYLEVDGNYGEINKLVNTNDVVIYIQNSAVGRLFIREQETINSTEGTEISFGTGALLGGYRYFSTDYGTNHKFSVVKSPTGVHFIDASNKKWIIFNGGILTLSDNLLFSKDIQGILKGSIVDTEDPLNGIGIYGNYDLINNRVYMTFLGANKAIDTGEKLIESLLIEGPTTGQGDIPQENSTQRTTSSKESLETIEKENYTLVVNESLNTLELYSSMKPTLYFNIGGEQISVETLTDVLQNRAYISYKGDYGTFFDRRYNSKIGLISAPKGSITKVYDSLEFKNEVYLNGVLQNSDTFTTIEAKNTYQNSNIIGLLYNNNIRRRLRTLRTLIPRDPNNPNNPRLRDYYLELKLDYFNNDNKQFILHDIIINYRISNY